MLVSQRNMGGFMKGILVKRLESSFHAFRMTLARFIDSYDKFIHMAEKGTVYISKKVDVYDLLDDGNIEKLMYLIEQQDVMEFKTKEFEARFMKELRQDLAQLNYLNDLWNMVDNDPKLDEFKKNLTQNRIMRGKKVIVFTESRETAEYLCENLKDIYGDSVIFFSGQSSQALKAEIEDSFNPKNAANNNDKYDLLITTDVLAAEMDFSTYSNEKIDIHHIFPKDYCIGQKYDKVKWNSIVNKTPISASSNREIGGVAPSIYLGKLEKKGSVSASDLDGYVETHWIEHTMLRNNKFQDFIIDRAKKLLSAIEFATGRTISGKNSDEVKQSFGAALD